MIRKTLMILGVVCVLGLAGAAWAGSPTDRAVETALAAELAKKYSDVRVAVEDRTATLTGTVDQYLDKVGAERKARKYKALSRVVNNITVGGPEVSDTELAERLSRKLAYDRPFQGNVFDAFWIGVKNGVVTLSGFAHTYPARDSAVGIVSAEKGVKDVVNKVEVLPLSIFDDQIRLAAARRIYGNMALQKYALDPARPIRIIVRNGKVILEGHVMNSMERTLAGLAASTLGGVFSVTNNLQVGSADKTS